MGDAAFTGAEADGRYFGVSVGQGDLSRRAPVGRLDEVGRLAMAFNRMVEELGSTTVSRNYIDNIIRSMGKR